MHGKTTPRYTCLDRTRRHSGGGVSTSITSYGVVRRFHSAMSKRTQSRASPTTVGANEKYSAVKHGEDIVTANNAANDWSALALALKGTRCVPVSVTVAVAVFFSRVVVRIDIDIVIVCVIVEDCGPVAVLLPRHVLDLEAMSVADLLMFAAGVLDMTSVELLGEGDREKVAVVDGDGLDVFVMLSDGLRVDSRLGVCVLDKPLRVIVDVPFDSVTRCDGRLTDTVLVTVAVEVTVASKVNVSAVCVALAVSSAVAVNPLVAIALVLEIDGEWLRVGEGVPREGEAVRDREVSLFDSDDVGEGEAVELIEGLRECSAEGVGSDADGVGELVGDADRW